MSPQLPFKLTDEETKALNACERIFFADAEISKALITLTKCLAAHPQLGDDGQRLDLLGYINEIFLAEPRGLITPEKRKLVAEFCYNLVYETPALSTYEKEKLNNIIRSRLFYTPIDRREAIEALQFYSPITVYRFCEVSSQFKSFCQTNLELEKIWAEILKDSGQLGETIESPDKKIQVPIFNQYIGTVILDQLEQSKQFINLGDSTRSVAFYDKSLLQKASELKLYSALAFRCQLNIEKLAAKPVNKAPIIGEIIQDARLLSAYWSAGFYQAGLALFAIANYFWQLQQTIAASNYFLLSIENFCKAYLFLNHPTSQKLQSFFAKEGIPAEEEVQKLLTTHGAVSVSEYQKIRKDIKKLLS